MGAVVVAAQVDVEVGGDLGVDLGQELLELDAAVTPVQAGDHRAVGDVKGSEQAGGAVPDVVVGRLLWHAGHHRERRLGPGQRLDLALLVHAEHHRRFGRVEVEPDDVLDLLHDQQIVGHLQPVRPVRLEFQGLPDPADRGLAQPTALGHLLP